MILRYGGYWMWVDRYGNMGKVRGMIGEFGGGMGWMGWWVGGRWVLWDELGVGIVVDRGDGVECGRVIGFVVVLEVEVKMRWFDLRVFEDGWVVVVLEFVVVIGLDVVVEVVGDLGVWLEKGLGGGVCVSG